MITKMMIHGHEIILFSVGQAGARLRRHAGTLRRLERDGQIPEPKNRSSRGYRLYTAWELTALEFAFKKHSCGQGKTMPPEFSETLKKLFSDIHRHIADRNHPLPKEVC